MMFAIEIGLALMKLHEQTGKVMFYMERQVKALRGVNGIISSVVLDNDVELQAGIVVMGAGVVPSTAMFSVSDRPIWFSHLLRFVL
jgi:NADPH-dependent 2,4-dienoyl-CoA reductase/sulfur reductase-like enzyme